MKRSLSTVNSLFNPLGLIAPVVIQGKILMQDLVSETTDWDLPLSDASKQECYEWMSSLKSLEELFIQRSYLPALLSSIVRRQIHIYSDVSEKAISAVAYMMIIDVRRDKHIGIGFFVELRLPPIMDTQCYAWKCVRWC